MSFSFEWPTFSPEFYDDARGMLAQALNRGSPPPIIADRIEVKELHMGTVPPELEILEIGDLSTDRFRGIFRLTYSGDAYIVLQTKVQANPLNVPRPTLDILGSPRILYAAAPLVVPMTLRLSALSLRAIVVLVVSRQKGITLVFKNDPLESVDVSSSFDGVESVAGYIQREIEGQLREAFRSDLPSVIHRLSLRWLSGEVESASGGAQGGFAKGAKIETKQAYGDTRRGFRQNIATGSVAGGSGAELAESIALASDYDGASTIASPRPGELRRSSGSASAYGVTSPSAASTHTFPSPDGEEDYDPTYGLRSDSMPVHAGFTEYTRVVSSGRKGRGLGDLLQDVDEEESMFDDDDGELEDSFDMVGLRDLLEDENSMAPMPSWTGGNRWAPATPRADDVDLIPAVGGGTITRPRIFHSQSQLRTRLSHGSDLSIIGLGGSSQSNASPGTPGSLHQTMGSMNGDERRSFAGTGYGNGAMNGHIPPSLQSTARSARSLPAQGRRKAFPPSLASGSPLGRPHTGLHAHPRPSSLSSVSPSPMPAYAPPSARGGTSQVPPSEADDDDLFPLSAPTDPLDLLSSSPSALLERNFNKNLPITLATARSDSCARLATLTQSDQTLSPFTRSHEHFTARSNPHIISSTGGGGSTGFRGLTPLNPARGQETNGPVKGTRKRVHRIGQAKRDYAAAQLAKEQANNPFFGQEDEDPFDAEDDSPLEPPSRPGHSHKGSNSSQFSDYFPTLSRLASIKGRKAARGPSRLPN